MSHEYPRVFTPYPCLEVLLPGGHVFGTLEDAGGVWVEREIDGNREVLQTVSVHKLKSHESYKETIQR